MRPALLLALLSAAPVAAQDTSADVRELLRLHEELLVAHRTGDVDRWMVLEGEPFVSVNGGRVAFPERSARREARAAYLATSAFEAYRDVREPVVRVSADGTLGWVVAEVEVLGSNRSGAGAPGRFHDVWAWVELYENVDGAWRLVGNASNRRPGEGGPS